MARVIAFAARDLAMIHLRKESAITPAFVPLTLDLAFLLALGSFSAQLLELLDYSIIAAADAPADVENECDEYPDHGYFPAF